MTEDRKEVIKKMDIPSLWEESRSVNDRMEEFVIDNGNTAQWKELNDLFDEQKLIDGLLDTRSLVIPENESTT